MEYLTLDEALDKTTLRKLAEIVGYRVDKEEKKQVVLRKGEINAS